MKLSFFKQPLKHHIIGYLGLTGAGKSLSMFELHVIPALISGRQVYTNTFINWKGDKCKTWTKWKELHHVRNSVIVIDEVGDSLDPNDYKNYSDEDKNVIRYHRKRKNTIIYTAQDLSDIAKQIRVKTHRFILCEENPDSPLSIWFLKNFFSIERVSFKALVLTFKDLKKLSLGIGSPAISSPYEEEDNNSFSEDISDIEDTLATSKDRPKPEDLRFTFKTLEHKELDDKKLFLYGAYCPSCEQFQAHLNTLVVPDEECSSCPSQKLILKALPMYDTNKELEVKEETEIIKKYKFINKRVLVPSDSKD